MRDIIVRECQCRRTLDPRDPHSCIFGDTEVRIWHFQSPNLLFEIKLSLFTEIELN